MGTDFENVHYDLPSSLSKHNLSSDAFHVYRVEPPGGKVWLPYWLEASTILLISA